MKRNARLTVGGDFVERSVRERAQVVHRDGGIEHSQLPGGDSGKDGGAGGGLERCGGGALRVSTHRGGWDPVDV